MQIAGVEGPLLERLTSIDVPRYDSVRGIDTLGLRILNSLRLDDRDLRVATAKRIYQAAPEGDVELLTPSLRKAIEEVSAPVNARIEQEWFTEPVPGLRFGAPAPGPAARPLGADELLGYLDRVLALCAEARRTASDAPPA